MRWWQMRKRDADLKRELQSDLELEEEEQRERGLPPGRSPPCGLARFRQSHSYSRAHSRCVGLERAGESSSRYTGQRPHSTAVAWLCNDCRAGDGVVHWRCDVAVHGGALGSAPAASLPRSGAAGDDLRAFPRSQHECAAVQLQPRCSRRLLRLARADPRLRRHGRVALGAIQPDRRARRVAGTDQRRAVGPGICFRCWGCLRS